MTSIIIDGERIQLDSEGFLINLSNWSKELSYKMAAQDDLELTPEHWEVIKFLQEYYHIYQIAPPIRILVKAIAKRIGKEKINSIYLYSLFQYGPAKQGCRYAGLPKPTGCI